MSTTQEHILRGFYTDHGRPWGQQTQYLCSNSNATVWTNALGIIVAITIARLFRLLLRLYELSFKPRKTIHKTPEAILWHRLLDWHQARQGGAIELHPSESETPRNRKRAPLKILLRVLLLGLSYLGILACSTLTARLATNSTALSDHRDCGIYQAVTNNSEEASFKIIGFNAELESGALTEKCFNTDAGTDGCNFFLQQSIPYQISGASCPFRDATMCSIPDSSVVRFSTGPVDVHVIGINMPLRVQFLRSTTCAPITVNETFAKAKVLNGSLFYYYYYGSTHYYPVTSLSVSSLEERDRPSMYRVNAKVSPEQWIPIPPLQARNGSSVSIIFVNSQGILYPEPSQDPIFPATKPYDVEHDIGLRYLRPSQRDNVLGCVDSIQWRAQDISATWYDLLGRDRTGTYFNLDWLKKVSPQSRGGLRLLLNSLTSSRIGMNIQSRQGMGLAASKLLEAGFSYKIAKEQWKQEARQLFETSLTRIQISARNLAQGVGAKYGLQRIEQGRKELCNGTFLFQSQGWRNVHVAGSVWILLWSLVVVLMAVPLDDERLLVEPVWQALYTFSEFTKDILPKYYHKVNRWAWDIRLRVR